MSATAATRRPGRSLFRGYDDAERLELWPGAGAGAAPGRDPAFALIGLTPIIPRVWSSRESLLPITLLTLLLAGTVAHVPVPQASDPAPVVLEGMGLIPGISSRPPPLDGAASYPAGYPADQAPLHAPVLYEAPDPIPPQTVARISMGAAATGATASPDVLALYGPPAPPLDIQASYHPPPPAAPERAPLLGEPDIDRGDLDRIRERGVLRVIVRPRVPSYFLSGGEVMGFEYELVRRFAQENGLHVQVVAPPPGKSLFDWLRQGKGDIVATPIPERGARAGAGVAFSRPYRYVKAVVVASADGDVPASTEDLGGRSVIAERGGAHWRALERLQQSGVDLTLVAAPGDMGPADMVKAVADGEYDLAVVDAPVEKTAEKSGADVVAALKLDEPGARRWAVRRDNPKLLAAIDAYVNHVYRGLFYNVLYQRYFENPGLEAGAASAAPGVRLSPYDAIVRKYARRYGFDWRLIVAQMYEESHFDPDARSPSGARGLMQLMPDTAPALGFSDVTQPRNSIHAGIKYLASLRERFDPGLSRRERTWFALAAYNAGFSRVQSARALAKRMGLDPDRWFGNVEKAMLALGGARGSTRDRDCGCSQSVRYVRFIRTRYAAYAMLGPPPEKMAERGAGERSPDGGGA